MAPFPSKAVANAFLNKGFADKVGIDPLKIQKLVYYAAGYYLAAYGIPLVDEPFEAWPKGPVLPTLYHEFKEFGYSSIRRLAEEEDWDGEFVPVSPPQDDPRAEKVMEYIWKKYGKRLATDLSEMTHVDNGPWDRTRRENTYNLRNVDIPNEYIREYFDPFIIRKK